jgi:hypothetical protein
MSVLAATTTIKPMANPSWYNVLLDGTAHGCYLEDDEPPENGQERQLGSIYARIDEVTTDTSGKPLLLASRRPQPTRG